MNRFLLTKLFFSVSLGHGVDRPQSEKGCRSITKVEEVIPSEIWEITVQSSATNITYFVVEATCEVIGQQTDGNSNRSSNTCYLRPDWERYIGARLGSLPLLAAPGDVPLGLLEQLQWTNHEEYAKGISKVWMSRIRKEGDLGLAKLTVAQRYIIACVVSNR